ncbi:MULTISPECIES: tyrosine-type recombinase/integrase [Kyrpidia]|uniref:Integrase n=2 Tax=Kyrpidia spormannii TaxID=2055160 RepID=A0ACA8Z839_9BACL|nr:MULTISPECIES: tyrosine-type recombinase/integrase [Kyrpidia]MCL6577484.1 tyrosine-type recombinase/integrase [Kyrpidia sp.]CAB3391621.1 Integrase [Kyrpidia spormannii]CAB3392533.1 Site-specific integrase [Kyrpidia spormannii]
MARARQARAKRTVRENRVKVSWQDAIEEYLMVRKAEGLRPATLKSQRQVLSLLYLRYPETWENPKAGVLKFLSEDIKPATYNIRTAYLKTFFDWCRKQGYMTENPIEGFKKRKAGHRIVNIEPDVLQRLLQLPDRSTYVGRRDYGLILLQLDTGIRPREAARLLPDDVNLRSGEVYVRAEASKTKVDRTLPISPATVKAIRELLAARPESWGPDVPVFASQDGTELSRYSWLDRLQKYSRPLGVRLTPYSLRHVFALEFLRNGGHALALQKMLGHADLTMTKRYVALTDGDMRQQHDMASPLTKLLPNRKRGKRAR